MKSTDPRDKKSEELNESELNTVAGGAGRRHPGQVWEPHMGENQEIVPEGPAGPGPIQEPDGTGLPKEDGTPQF